MADIVSFGSTVFWDFSFIRVSKESSFNEELIQLTSLEQHTGMSDLLRSFYGYNDFICDLFEFKLQS